MLDKELLKKIGFRVLLEYEGGEGDSMVYNHFPCYVHYGIETKEVIEVNNSAMSANGDLAELGEFLAAFIDFRDREMRKRIERDIRGALKWDYPSRCPFAKLMDADEGGI